MLDARRRDDARRARARVSCAEFRLAIDDRRRAFVATTRAREARRGTGGDATRRRTTRAVRARRRERAERTRARDRAREARRARRRIDGAEGARRRWFGDAREDAARAPTTASKISDGLGTAALVVGAGVGCVVGGSMYASTTEELARRVEAGEHVPTAMRGTPLEGAYGMDWSNKC